MNIPSKKKVDVAKNFTFHDILTGVDTINNSKNKLIIQSPKNNTDLKAETSSNDNDESDQKTPETLQEMNI